MQKPRPTEAPAPSNKQHKILSLDGGGTIGGYAETLSLAEIYGENTSGHKILGQFDDVYATSAGCLVGAALAANYTPKEIRGMLECPEFLEGIYADKKAGLSPQAAKEGQFVKNPNTKGLVSNLKETQRDFITAATEITTGGLYDTDKKTTFLRHVLDHNLDPNHPAAKAVPSLANKSQMGLGSSSFNDVSKKLGVNFTFLCQDRNDKKINAVTTKNNVPDEGSLLDGQQVRYLKGNTATFAEATSASPNPRPLFNKPVCINGRNCDDGGMTGHNSPVAFGIANTLQHDNVNPQNVSVLSVGLGPLKKSYTSPTALKTAMRDPMLYGSMPFDKFFEEEQGKRMNDVCSMLPNADQQIVRLAPTSNDTSDPFNYASSMMKKEEQLKELKKWGGKYLDGNIPNQQIDNKGTLIGHADAKSGISAAQQKFGSQQAPTPTPTATARPHREQLRQEGATTTTAAPVPQKTEPAPKQGGRLASIKQGLQQKLGLG